MPLVFATSVAHRRMGVGLAIRHGQALRARPPTSALEMDQCRSRSGQLSWIDNPGDSHGGAAMARTMKAAVVREFGKPLVIERGAGAGARTGSGPGQDRGLRRLSHRPARRRGRLAGQAPPPFIPGHEGVGFVTALGADVRHVKEGDRVGVPWLYTACGHCEYCLSGWETLCDAQQNTGYSVNGGFADYVLADPNLCRPSAGQSRTSSKRHPCSAPASPSTRPEGDRHQARRLGGHLRHRRPRPRRRAIRQGDGPQRRRGRHRRRQARPCQWHGADVTVNARARIRPPPQEGAAARTACW